MMKNGYSIKNKYKTEFKKALDSFTEKLEKYVSTENEIGL